MLQNSRYVTHSHYMCRSFIHCWFTFSGGRGRGLNQRGCGNDCKGSGLQRQNMCILSTLTIIHPVAIDQFIILKCVCYCEPGIYSKLCKSTVNCLTYFVLLRDSLQKLHKKLLAGQSKQNMFVFWATAFREGLSQIIQCCSILRSVQICLPLTPDISTTPRCLTARWGRQPAMPSWDATSPTSPLHPLRKVRVHCNVHLNAKYVECCSCSSSWTISMCQNANCMVEKSNISYQISLFI